MTLPEVALDIARSFEGVREHGKNRGPHVDEFIRSVGLDPRDGAYPWCAAFVYFCLSRAAKAVGVPCPAKRTASVMSQFRFGCVHGYKVQHPAPGDVFLMDKGGGKGHCGFVESVCGTHLVTIEGNTDPDGGRDGDGVYRRLRRPEEVTLGFLRFVERPPEETNA